jgi:hypothetical protein
MRDTVRRISQGFGREAYQAVGDLHCKPRYAYLIELADVDVIAKRDQITALQMLRVLVVMAGKLKVILLNILSMLIRQENESWQSQR